MKRALLIYGSTGFVGTAIARAAADRGLRPILAGRDAVRVEAAARALGLEHRSFDVSDAAGARAALRGVAVVLNCAGPFIRTYRGVSSACIDAGTHYLDLTGEPRVYEGLAERDAEARRRGVMLLPGVGFDVSATDCLAVHLKARLPSATHLALAFQLRGPAAIPPGTANTLIEVIPGGVSLRRRAGRLERAPRGRTSRRMDFGQGEIRAELLTWGDCVMSFHSTGIPNIETYAVLPPAMAMQLKLARYTGPLFRLGPVRWGARRMLTSGSTPEERSRSRVDVWGEVADDSGRTAVSRLHGPEGGVEWTTSSALAAVDEVMAGRAPAGFQTVGRAFGANFVLKCPGVTREDLAG